MPPNSQTFEIVLALLFIAGVGLYAISFALPGKIVAPLVAWPQRIDVTAVGLELGSKLAIIERLGLVGAPWCEEILRQADAEEDEPALRHAIAAALADCRQATMR